MSVMHAAYNALANPTVYRLWQAPFAEAKFRPVRRHNDLTQVRRVLDVGCGPGTNAALFKDNDYLGLDLNEEYVRQARERFGRPFEVADVCTYEADEQERFDFILLNSLLHHIDDDGVTNILSQLGRQMTPDGHVHIIDLVLPDRKCPARTLALADRGDFARPLEAWQQLFEAHFEPVVFEPFPVKLGGVTLWQLVYFKGAVRA